MFGSFFKILETGSQVAQASLELPILLPPPLECRDDRCTLSCLVIALQGINLMESLYQLSSILRALVRFFWKVRFFRKPSFGLLNPCCSMCIHLSQSHSDGEWLEREKSSKSSFLVCAFFICWLILSEIIMDLIIFVIISFKASA